MRQRAVQREFSRDEFQQLRAEPTTTAVPVTRPLRVWPLLVSMGT